MQKNNHSPEDFLYIAKKGRRVAILDQQRSKLAFNFIIFCFCYFLFFASTSVSAVSKDHK